MNSTVTIVTIGIRNPPVIICANIAHIQYSPTCLQELAPEVAARIAEAERIAAEAEAEAAAFAEQAAAVQAEHELMRQEQLQAIPPPHPAASCLHLEREKMLYHGLNPGAWFGPTSGG